MLRPAHAILAISLGLLLGGCPGQEPPASTLGGECKLVETPKYAVRGKTGYDQAWVNRTTEALVVGCGQPRPAARPPEFDTPGKLVAPKPAKKPWWQKKPLTN